MLCLPIYKPAAENFVYSREKLTQKRTLGRAGIIQTIPEEIKKKRHRGCRAGAKVKARLAAK